jgi:hypothetical protein
MIAAQSIKRRKYGSIVTYMFGNGFVVVWCSSVDVNGLRWSGLKSKTMADSIK